jgi:chromosome partitioning protein
VKVVATYSIKGGVGKTSTAVNLAYEAAESGGRVLLWDLDPQGAATYFVRVKPVVKGGAAKLVGSKGALAPHVRATDHPSLHLVPSDFSLRHLDLHLDHTKDPRKRLDSLLHGVVDHYDLALLDCPPGISLSSEAVFGASGVLLVPTIPTTLSARTLDQLAAFLREERQHLGRSPEVLPFFSMVDRRKKLQRQLVTSLRAERPSFLQTEVPNASAVERMARERLPVAVVAPRSAAARAFHDLWRELAGHLWT